MTREEDLSDVTIDVTLDMISIKMQKSPPLISQGGQVVLTGRRRTLEWNVQR